MYFIVQPLKIIPEKTNKSLLKRVVDVYPDSDQRVSGQVTVDASSVMSLHKCNSITSTNTAFCQFLHVKAHQHAMHLGQAYEYSDQ